jgi:hypothetical protein
MLLAFSISVIDKHPYCFNQDFDLFYISLWRTLNLVLTSMFQNILSRNNVEILHSTYIENWFTEVIVGFACARTSRC